LAIDKCLLHDDTQEHCDFAVFDDSTFCFVEIKKGHPEHKRRNQIKKKAYRQLKQTIAIFLNQGVDFSHIDLEAIVCLAGEDFHPVANSTSQDAIVEFLSLGAKLLIGEMKEF
jgi:Holliday junction resolvase-like predicted endonuclease